MIVELPTTLLGWVTLIGFLGMGISIVFFTWRNQNLKLLREQVKDMEGRIKFLSDEVEVLKKTNNNLTADYKDLKFKKNYLKQIVIEALATKKGISESLMEEITDSVKLAPKEIIK